jgi:serine/threonine-protein kinase
LIQHSLGSGGMGAVFLGIDETTGERAAVKMLSPALGADVNFRERFGTEVETLKKLRHPNIVQLLGFGEQDGQLFYAMEMVDGQSLQQDLQAGRRFEWRAVTRIGVQICQALKHAHDRGVIHRDLKPANLLHTTDDQIKLADFGIAKLYGMSQLTVAGGVIGTADYMSPEQGDGTAVTARSDLYSLGSVLFTLLAGRPPFASRTAAEVIHKLHYEEAIPVRRLAPDTPEEFELIIAQLLEKDPAKRIATAIAVANRLKAMEYGLSLETRVETPSDRFSLTSDEEYQLAGEPDDQPTVVARTETRLVTPAERALELEMDSVEQHRKATVAMSNLVAPENASLEAESVHSTHFTTFDEAARQRATSLSDPEEHVPWWLKIAPLLAAGALIGSGIWYFSRPLSDEALYGRIMDVAREGESRDLVSVEDEINEFLQRFSTDDRAQEVRTLHEELDLYRLQRQYERRSRLRGGSETLGPIERAYVEATQLAAVNPQAAIVKLQALLNVFSGGEPSKSDQRCLKLAREQLDQLQARGQDVSAADLKAIQQRLDTADALSRDDPTQAAAIRRGIIELYGDKPWAEPAVSRARASLGK